MSNPNIEVVDETTETAKRTRMKPAARKSVQIERTATRLAKLQEAMGGWQDCEKVIDALTNATSWLDTAKREIAALPEDYRPKQTRRVVTKTPLDEGATVEITERQVENYADMLDGLDKLFTVVKGVGANKKRVLVQTKSEDGEAVRMYIQRSHLAPVAA